MAWKLKLLGAAAVPTIALLLLVYVTAPDATTGVPVTPSTTAASPTTGIIQPAEDPGWLEQASEEAALLRWREAEAANARASRSRPRERNGEAKETKPNAPAATATRGTTSTQVAPATDGPSDAFWLRLSKGCECRDPGGCVDSGGWFQFKGDTARKAGYVPGSSYADQLAAAKRWLAKIGGRGGTTAGWPRCWWKAGGG